jgi:hypothetical protein
MEDTQSNFKNMKRHTPRSEVAASRVKKAWHALRHRKKTKTADGEIRFSQNDGPSLKEWAKQEIKDKGSLATECSLWLELKNKIGKKELKNKIGKKDDKNQ